MEPNQVSRRRSSNQPQCPLLNLPAELRDEIYRDAMTVHPNRDGTVLLFTSSSHVEIPSVLSLLLTCRQVHNEAQEMFYSINNLEVGGFVASLVFDNCLLQGFIDSLSTKRRSAIQSFTIMIEGPERGAMALRILSQLPKLKTLHFKMMRRKARQYLVERNASAKRCFMDAFRDLPALETINIGVPFTAFTAEIYHVNKCLGVISRLEEELKLILAQKQHMNDD